MLNESQPSGLSFTPEVVDYIANHGLDEHEVEDWVLRSAIVSHPDGNRRFNDWIFRVKGGVVLSINEYARVEAFTEGLLKPGEFRVTEPCPACEGGSSGNAGQCLECGGNGTITVIRKKPKPTEGVMR